MIGRTRVVSLAALLCAACASADYGDYTYAPIVWRGLGTKSVSGPASAQDEAELDRVRQGTALSLRDCLRLAIAKSEQLAASGEDYIQSIITQDKEFAQVLPTVNLRGQYFRQETAPDFGRSSGFSPRGRAESQLRLSQPIFSGFRDIHTLKALEELTKAKENSLVNLREQILFYVASVYFDILNTSQQVEVLARSLDSRKQRLADLKERRKANLVRETEVLLVEAQVAEDEAQLDRVNNDLVVLRTRLGVLTGMAMEGKKLEQPPDVTVDADLERMLLDAYEHRNDLKALKNEAIAAAENVSVAYAGYLPRVSLDGTVYLRRVGVSEDVDWDMLLSAELPLFDGWLTRAAVAEALSKQRKAQHLYDNLRERIKDEVVSAYHDLKTAESAVSKTEKELEYARRNFELLKHEYDNKIATNLELLLADVALQDVQIRLNSERLNKSLAALRLKLACGSNLLGDNGK